MAPKTKLDNDILDRLIEKIAYKSLEVTEDVCGAQMSQATKIEYICRTYTEILGVLICAAPESEVQKVCANVTGWLNSVVGYNLNFAKATGMPMPSAGQSLDNIFKDSFMTNKKALA